MATWTDTTKFGPNGELGSIAFGLEDEMMTIQFNLPGGRISPKAFLAREEADELIAAFDGDGRFHEWVVVDDPHKQELKSLICFRDAEYVTIGLGPDTGETEGWGFHIQPDVADAMMARMHPLVRFGMRG